MNAQEQLGCDVAADLDSARLAEGVAVGSGKRAEGGRPGGGLTNQV